ncbi:MAG: nucleotidyltransferase substrate binding protein [Pseudomonadales bacterium]|nr:nucleotidyltransferase substrate binding protein [Pseudomonadales bacterium]
MSIDFSSFESAINQLEKSIMYVNSDIAKTDDGLREQLRNSVIQCFEFTYELSHKMLKRYLEDTAASPQEIDLGSFQTIIRIGNEKNLLRSDWRKWKNYRQARTDSSHAYDQEKAEATFITALDFLDEARCLYQALIGQDEAI